MQTKFGNLRCKVFGDGDLGFKVVIPSRRESNGKVMENDMETGNI